MAGSNKRDVDARGDRGDASPRRDCLRGCLAGSWFELGCRRFGRWPYRSARGRCHVACFRDAGRGEAPDPGRFGSAHRGCLVWSKCGLNSAPVLAPGTGYTPGDGIDSCASRLRKGAHGFGRTGGIGFVTWHRSQRPYSPKRPHRGSRWVTTSSSRRFRDRICFWKSGADVWRLPR
jgi:hypothetical protein